MNLQNKNHRRFCQTDRWTDGHYWDLAQLKFRKVKVLVINSQETGGQLQAKLGIKYKDL